MEPTVIDANILVSSFLETEESHQRAMAYIQGMENGDYTFHLPMLAVVELISAISRRAQTNRQALLLRAMQSINNWEHDGKIILYPLDRARMTNAVHIAQQHRLRGADSVFAALAEELDMPLKTFDQGILDRFQRASV